jgi:pimeloyl-ACP methyl ester carboxylesterase
MNDAMMFEDIYFTSRDGLRLYARHYPARSGARRPALCLAGLTRNSKDFHELALALSQDAIHPRPVLALDSRGRGRSQHDRDWRNYTPLVEMHDVIDLLIIAAWRSVSVVGTSRGGLLAMLLAAAQPGAVGAMVLNDIGPVIDRDGLARIAGYVGRAPLPGSWAEAARMVRDMNVRHFPSVPEPDWDLVARAWFNERGGKPAPGYDPSIANAFSVLDGPIPPLWPQFAAATRLPVMVLRGENSDLLSVETVEEMRRRHPGLTVVTVKGQGHAPFLRDAASVNAIRDFLGAADVGQAASGYKAA